MMVAGGWYAREKSGDGFSPRRFSAQHDQPSRSSAVACPDVQPSRSDLDTERSKNEGDAVAEKDEELPPCDPFVKKYLLHGVGLAAWINSAQTEYYERRREGLEVTVIRGPHFLQRKLARCVVWCVLLFPVVFLLALLLGWMVTVWVGWSYLKDHLQDPNNRAIAVVILLIAGVLICVAKQRYQSFAGFAEVEVGIVACWAGLGKINDPDSGAVYAIAAGIYLISRGAENVYLGWRAVRAMYREYKTALKWVKMF
jgi:hypothetical protein